MAIQIDYVARFGVTIPDDYVRVTEVHQLNKTRGLAIAAAYVNSEVPLDQFIEQTGSEFAYDVNGAGPFEQAYEFLKSRPQMVGAVDC